MIKSAKNITNSIVEYNQKFETNTILGPYIYLNKEILTDPKYFKMQDTFNEEFSKLAPKQYEKYFCLCLSFDILSREETFNWINSFINDYNPKKLYLRISDFVIGKDPSIDKGVIRLLNLFDSKKIETIYSHGPAWVYLLFAKGLTGFSSGIGYQSLFKQDDLVKEKGGKFDIKHNIYVPKRFCKLNPDSFKNAYENGIIELCNCKACSGIIPNEKSSIRIHSVYSRLDELSELNNCGNIQNSINNWITESTKLISQLNSNKISFTQEISPEKMLTFLQL